MKKNIKNNLLNLDHSNLDRANVLKIAIFYFQCFLGRYVDKKNMFSLLLTSLLCLLNISYIKFFFSLFC